MKNKFGNKIHGWAASLAIVVTLGLSGCSQPATEPVFEEAWIRAIPPGIKMTAGFGKLHNGTASAINIESFSSPFFRSVSLHRSEVVEGVNRMEEVDGYKLCVGETLDLAPGGYHLMLMMPLQSIVNGQVVPLQLLAADGSTYTFDVAVEKR